jgi:hypothetical protein
MTIDISMGNVLMLSQIAWRTGRAFTSSRRGSPHEFREIQLELSRLSKSLKFLAETLFSEDTEDLIQQACERTQAGILSVIQFCQHTLDGLESLVQQYVLVKKNGHLVERSWSDMVLKNYNGMIWTTEGGNIRDLRDMLHMHTSTTSLIRQALERLVQLGCEDIVQKLTDTM